jgi:hypothetical protein
MCDKVQIFANESNRSKSPSGGNLEVIVFVECLIVFSLEPSVLLSAIKNLKIEMYKILILSMVLYWCQILFLILREEHRLKFFSEKNT